MRKVPVSSSGGRTHTSSSTLAVTDVVVVVVISPSPADASDAAAADGAAHLNEHCSLSPWGPKRGSALRRRPLRRRVCLQNTRESCKSARPRRSSAAGSRVFEDAPQKKPKRNGLKPDPTNNSETLNPRKKPRGCLWFQQPSHKCWY